jgi:hypothetical protein
MRGVRVAPHLHDRAQLTERQPGSSRWQINRPPPRPCLRHSAPVTPTFFSPHQKSQVVLRRAEPGSRSSRRG